jgi:ribonuclease HII
MTILKINNVPVEKILQKNNPKGVNAFTKDSKHLTSYEKEEMYKEIRELTIDINKFQHIIRPKLQRRAVLLKKYFEV